VGAVLVVMGLGAALLDVAVAAGTEVVAVRAVAVPVVVVVGTVAVAVVAVAVADGVDEAVAVELVLLDGGLVVRTCTMSSAAEHAASTVVSAAAPATTAPHRPRARRRPIAALPKPAPTVTHRHGR
jgi:hypothetical protein